MGIYIRKDKGENKGSRGTSVPRHQGRYQEESSRADTTIIDEKEGCEKRKNERGEKEGGG
jgi:hypothetical protein